MNETCPHCKSPETKEVLFYNDGSDNIDNLGHWHLRCPTCGFQFNKWQADAEKLKKIFGAQYEQYK